jgi:SulP family sulfate permease
MNLSRLVPALRWGKEYRAAWLGPDIVAGITLGAVMVPVGLAFGELAGMPLAGLYAGMVPLVAYALFSSSRQLVIGPDATMATVVALTIAPLAAGDPARLALLVALTAAGVGLVCISAGLLRLGFMADFLAKPVIVGFMHGLAFIIFVGQLPNVLGIQAHGDSTPAQFVHVLRSVGQVHLTTLVIGVSCVVLILGLHRWAPRVPGQVLVLLGALAAVHLLALHQAGVAVVGDIPGGLPSLRVPAVTMADVRLVSAVALGAALLAFSDSIVTARGFASRNRYRLDANQELVALGLGNIASAVTQGLPVSGSGSRTAVAESAGSRTQLTSVFAAATLACVMLFLTPYLAELPSAALGAILIVAAYSLCDFAEFRRIWTFRGAGLVCALLVLASVIGIGVMEGILLGVAVSLIVLVQALAFPRDAILGQTGDGFRDMTYHPDARPVPGTLIYSFSAPLFFANSGHFRSRIEELIQGSETPPKLIVIEASAISEIDLAGCETLIEVGEALRAQGIRLAIVQLRDPIKARMARAGVPAALGEETFVPTIAEALKAGR